MSKIERFPALSRRLSLRLLGDEAELSAVQALRWNVFYEEMGAIPTSSHQPGRDADAHDPLCDHLLVIDEDRAPGERIVGTYRLLRESVARANGGFYSASEFDIAPLALPAGAEGGELLELGRSCVLPAYRDSATIQLLWRGIADYVARHGIRLMFGCASFHGIDPEAHAASLSFLHHHHLAPAELRPRARGADTTAIDRLPLGSYDARRAMHTLPPLVKGYLRVGAMVGEGAFIDRQFNTIDVCIVMPVEMISQRYASRFSIAA